MAPLEAPWGPSLAVKLPKLFSPTGAKLVGELASRVKEWTDQATETLTGLRSSLVQLEKDMAALQASPGGVSSVFGRDGDVVAAAGDYAASEITDDSASGPGTDVASAIDDLYASIPAAYTDEQAQDAVGAIVLPSSGPVRLTYSDSTPSITAAVDDMVGDSGSGGTKGLVPAPASGTAAAGKFLKADGTWAVPSGFTAAYFRGYFAQTGNLTWSSTTWADVHTVMGGTVGSFTDDYTVGITRSNSTFTFSAGGVYWANIIVKFAVSNNHFGLRIRQSNTTVLQQGAYDSASVRTMVLAGPLVLNANDTVTVQFCQNGTNATITTAQLNGEDQHAMNWSFFRLA